MTREELIAYDRWLTENKWGSSEIITPEQAADLYLAEQPLPPAEGAEEIEAELRGYARDIVRLHKPIMEVNPQLAMDSIGNDLVKMFNRLAQRLAEKMVEEKKCYYCNGDGQVVQDYEHGEIGKCTICNGTGKIRK